MHLTLFNILYYIFYDLIAGSINTQKKKKKEAILVIHSIKIMMYTPTIVPY